MLSRLLRTDRPDASVPFAQMALLLGLIFLDGCATAYSPAGAAAGYSEQQLSRNVFLVGFGQDGGKPDARATDLCLLRCAEVTLAHGFSHFVVLKSEAGLASQETAATNGIILSRLASGKLTYVSAQTAKPSSANTIACFRRPPVQFAQAYEAKGIRDQIALRYHLEQKLGAAAEPAEAYQPQFDLYPLFLFLPKTNPELITFLEPSTTRRSILIGDLTEWENPYATLDEFKHKAAVAASILGGQAILIRDATVGKGFRAELLLMPKAHLGIQDAGGDWPRKEMIISGFDKESLAPSAGLKIGDRIIELDGTDVLRQKRFADCWLSWTVGEDVVVTFIRDGTKRTTQAKTIAN